MTLYINTVAGDEVIVSLGDRQKIIRQKKIRAARQQGEKLLPAIAALLAAQKLEPTALRKIVVANRGGSFTSLRIGVITANALGYALKIPVRPEFPGPKKAKKFAGRTLVEPIYDREPEIGKAKKLVF